MFIYNRNHFQRISLESASARPYRPPIHVLVLPSQLPMDLRLGIRDLDEDWLVSNTLSSSIVTFTLIL
jgi:hypothetical protein